MQLHRYVRNGERAIQVAARSPGVPRRYATPGGPGCHVLGSSGVQAPSVTVCEWDRWVSSLVALSAGRGGPV